MKAIMKKLRIFTVMTLIAAIIVILLQVATVKAECPNPVGGSFVYSDGTRLVFSQGWTSRTYILQAYSEGEFIGGVPYEWCSETCEAVLDCIPALYLRVQEGYVELSDVPRFMLEY